MPARKPVLTPSQLKQFLAALLPFGFIARRVEVSPDGGVTLHAEAADAGAKPDLLAQWEIKRASRPN